MRRKDIFTAAIAVGVACKCLCVVYCACVVPFTFTCASLQEDLLCNPPLTQAISSRSNGSSTALHTVGPALHAVKRTTDTGPSIAVREGDKEQALLQALSGQV